MLRQVLVCLIRPTRGAKDELATICRHDIAKENAIMETLQLITHAPISTM